MYTGLDIATMQHIRDNCNTQDTSQHTMFMLASTGSCWLYTWFLRNPTQNAHAGLPVEQKKLLMTDGYVLHTRSDTYVRRFSSTVKKLSMADIQYSMA